jgi:hypothetical protein
LRIACALLLLGAFVRADPLTWELEPSAFLRYAQRDVKQTEDGKEKLGAESIVTVQGHDLRDGGQYLPATPDLDDLPAILGLSLRGDTSGWKLKLRHVVQLSLKGTVEQHPPTGKDVEIVATWRFASRGEAEADDTERIAGGEAEVHTVYDAVTRRVASARVSIRYRAQKLDPKEDQKKDRTVDKVIDLAWREGRGPRWEGQQQEINAAIDRGVKHLRSLQKEDGTFEPHGDRVFGSTALVVLTLASCDVPRDDPAITKALAWLFAHEPDNNYDRALFLMAVDRVYTPPDEIAAALRRQWVDPRRDLPDDRRASCLRVAAALEAAGPGKGSWDYKEGGGSRRTIRRPDSSNTQIAVLGLRAAAKLGYEVDEQTWLGVIRHFKLLREKKAPPATVDLVYEGEVQPETKRVRAAAGFRYRVDHAQPWGSMTCAGIATLAIVREELEHRKSAGLASVEAEVEEMILGGWAWLDRNWGMDRNPGHPNGEWYYYYLYSVERAGILTGVKRVGEKDWYLEGAAQLLARQKESGAWDEPGKGDTSETCFALLFLKRATTPTTRTSR